MRKLAVWAVHKLLDFVVSAAVGFAKLFPHVWRWYLWSVVVAGLIPLVVLWGALGFRAHHLVPVTEVTGHGEIFLITSVLLFTEVGALWDAKMKKGVGAVLFLIVFIASVGLFIWSGILASDPGHSQNQVHGATGWGLVFLGTTLILGSAAKLVTKTEAGA